MSAIPEKYLGAVKKAMIAAAGCGPLGALSGAADLAAIAGVWGTFLYTVARGEQVALDRKTTTQVCKSVLLGAAGYYAGCKMATRLFALIPGAGLLLGMGVSALANILFTYRFALSVCTVFSGGGSESGAEKLAAEILYAFRGNGTVNDVKEIVRLLAAVKPAEEAGAAVPEKAGQASVL